MSSNRYEPLLERSDFADIVLKVGNERFRAHQSILAAKSPVLASIFAERTNDVHNGDQDMLELKISKASSEAGRQFMRYIYTGRVRDLDRHAKSLLEIADKLQIPQLKLMCEQHLTTHLRPDNVLKCYLLADRHKCSRLLQACITFLDDNFKEVSSTASWTKLLKHEPQLAAPLFDSMVQRVFERCDSKIKAHERDGKVK